MRDASIGCIMLKQQAVGSNVNQLDFCSSKVIRVFTIIVPKRNAAQ